jgi:type II secretory pathway pseudopilin PulG
MVKNGREDGYNLVMLVVAITILNIMVAIALPSWSYVIRRDREEETISRGLQYAEAIRVFKQRNGRYPATLDELVKIEPRSIRQLWKEPLTEAGEFGLVVEQLVPQAQPGQPGQPGAPPGGEKGKPSGQPQPQPVATPEGVVRSPFGIGGGTSLNLVKLPRGAKGLGGKNDENLTTSEIPLAIHGVYLDKTGDSLRKFFGKDKYEQWTFTVEMIPPPVTAPGRPLPNVRDDWIGKGFPDGLGGAPGSGTGPSGQPVPGTEVGGNAGKPGSAAPGAGQKGKPGEPQPEPDTPSEFPEDAPEEPPETIDDPAPPDDNGAGEAPADEQPATDPGDQGLR